MEKIKQDKIFIKSEVVDKNKQTADALQRFLAKTYPEINDLLLVNLDHLDKKSVGRMLQHEQNPIILYGFQNITDPNLESKLVSIFPMLKNGNVGFMRMPAILKEEILDQYLKLKEKNSELDRLVFTLEGKAKQQLANRLLHDLQSGKPYSIKNNAPQEAKDVLCLDNVSEEEIIQKLEQIKLEGQKQIDVAKDVIKGVFCDTAGTLLVGEKGDELNLQTVELLKLLELQGHKITIWTGGDEKQYAQILKAKGITWPVVSKYDYENKRIEIAIDDLPQKKYEKDYRIFAEKFIKIN